MFLFVFNDKGSGVSCEIERALSELRQENPTIIFDKFTPKDLEKILFGLNDDQILALGFDTNLTNGLKIAYEYLEKVEADLDRDNTRFVEKALVNISDIVVSLNDEDLRLHFEILQARTLERLEKVQEARSKYENLSKRYPNDPRPILYEAEIELHADDLEKNINLLYHAEAIDKEFWLLALEKLLRSYVTNETIDLSTVDEKNFPHNPKIKASFYRIYSGFFEQAGDSEKANYFIERAITLFPDKYANYDAKLGLLERRLFLFEEEKEQKRQHATRFLSEIDLIVQDIFNWEELGSRNKALICYRKFNAYQILEELSLVEQNAKTCFELLLQCYFDHTIDIALSGILDSIELPDQDLRRLLNYLLTAKKRLSDTLAKRLILQFMLKDTLYTEGKEYFQQTGCTKISDFIHNIEEKNMIK